MSLFKNRPGRSILGFMTSFGYIVVAVLVYFLTSAGLLWSIFWPIWLIIQLYHFIFG
jgi:hypothetical protein